MKNKHFITFLLIMLTTVAFVSYFFVEYKYQIYYKECAAAVFACYVRKPPDVAKSHSRTSCNSNHA